MPNYPTTERKDGVTIIAQDFQTSAGVKLSDSSTFKSGTATNGQVLTANGSGGASWENGGGGGPAQSPLSGKHKNTIANNASTPLFSFPLADGEAVSLGIFVDIVAKHGTDVAISNVSDYPVFANGGGTLHSDHNSLVGDTISNGGSVIAGIATLSFSLSGGVLTVSVVTPDFGTTDSIIADYALLNPQSVVITDL